MRLCEGPGLTVPGPMSTSRHQVIRDGVTHTNLWEGFPLLRRSWQWAWVLGFPASVLLPPCLRRLTGSWGWILDSGHRLQDEGIGGLGTLQGLKECLAEPSPPPARRREPELHTRACGSAVRVLASRPPHLERTRSCSPAGLSEGHSCEIVAKAQPQGFALSDPQSPWYRAGPCLLTQAPATGAWAPGRQVLSSWPLVSGADRGCHPRPFRPSQGC